MKQLDAVTKLRALKIRVDVEVVHEAVQRLRNGGSVYSLHSGYLPLVAKATAKKIRDLWKEGKLSFLFDIRPDFEAAQQAGIEVADVSPVWLEDRFMDSHESEDIQDRIKKQLEEYIKGQPKFEWDIETLETIGIPLETALEHMVEREILFDRQAPYIIGGRSDWRLLDLQRWIEIDWTIRTCLKQSEKEHCAPFEFIELVAATFAKAYVNNNRFLMRTSGNILRYQVWRGPKFVEAFKRAQIPTHRAAKQLKRTYDELITNMSEALMQNVEEVTDG